MTEPRQFLPDTTYFITRRCTQRLFLLKPTALNNQIFLYCLAVAAQRTGIVIHAVTVISNHYHAIVSDPGTNIVGFYAWLHKYVSKAVNCSLGRFENMWSSEKPSVIALKDQADLLDKIVYTLCNPVEARLVAHGSKWPGVWLYKRSHSRTIKRPDVYFSKDGDMPKSAQLNIKAPPQFEHLSQQEFEKLIASELAQREQVVCDEMQLKGHSFMGIQGIMRQRHRSSPLNQEERFKINPNVAAKNKWLRIEAIQRRGEFLKAYRKAYKRWRQGDREVVFPAGTYALRVHAGVRCHPG